MAVDTPAQPSTSGLATTTSESRGGFFTDTNGVGIDLSGTQGQQGPQGPEGPPGDPGAPGVMGAQGVSFVDIFFSPTFDVTGIDMVLSPSTVFDQDATGASVSHTYRTYVRSDNTRYFTDGNIGSFNLDADLRSNFQDDVRDGTLGISLLQGPAGSDGQDGAPGEAGLDGATGARGAQGETGPAGTPGMNGMDGADGDTYIPVFFNLPGVAADRLTLDASLTLTTDLLQIAYVPLSEDFIFAGGVITGFNAQDFELRWSQGLIGYHPVGGRGPQGMDGDMGLPGTPGIDGNTVTVWYATSADGQNAVTTYTDEQFIAFETHTAGTAPTAPTEFERFVGTDGMDGAEAPRISTIAVQNEMIDSAGDNLVTLRITLNDTPASTYDVTFTAPEGPQGPMGQMGSGGTGTTISAGPGIQIIGTAASVDLAADSGLEFTTTDATGQLRINVGDGLAITSGELHTTGASTDTTYSLTVEDHANGAQLVLTDLLTNTRVAVHPIVGADAINVSNVNGTVRIQGHDTSYTYSVREQSPAGTGDIELVIAPDVGDPGTNQIISLEEGHGIDFELVDAQTFRISSTGEIPSGTALPTTVGASGDTFIVIGNADDNLDGFYYSDGTNWIKDDTTYTFTGGRQARLTVNPSDAASTTIDVGGVSVWAPGTAYVANDQVIHDSNNSGVNSIYVAVNGITSTTPPNEDQLNWHLVRSGIVSVQANNETTPHPLTGNTTLHFIDGPGIDITRRDGSADFTIGVQHTGTHDVDEFTPGWAYTYYDIENNVSRTGEVAASVGNATFNEGFFIRAGVRLIFSSGDSFSDGDRFAFRTYGTVDVPAGETAGSRTVLFPTATQDYIVYCQRTTSPTNTAEATILQIDPPVNNIDELAALFGATSDGDRRIFNPALAVSLFGLDEHHETPTSGTYAWAHTGNTSRIPTNKLPTDIAYAQSVDVTRSADDTTPEAIAIDANGALSLSLQPQPKDIQDLDNVTTDPTAAASQQVLMWRTPGDALETDHGYAAVTEAGYYNEFAGTFTLSDLVLTEPTDTSVNQVLQYDSDADHWVNIDLPTMASGRIEFTQSGSAYVATAFIEDPTIPTQSTPISSTSITAGNGSQLAFTLARAATLSLNVLDFPQLPWDQPFTDGQQSIQFSSTTDPLYPGQELANLTSDNSNIAINPNTGTGPWTVSFTDTSVILSNAVSGSVNGGSFPQSTFNAVNNTTTAAATPRDAAGVTWHGTGLDLDNARFNSSNTFLNPIVGYNFSFHANNISVNNNARWMANLSTLNGGATTTVDSLTNTPGNAGGIGQAGTIGVVVTDYTAYNNVTVPTDTIGVEFTRPAGVTGTEYTRNVTLTVADQPTWTYPVFWLVSASNATPPEFVASGNRVLFSTSKTRTIPSLTTVDVVANATGGGTRYVWVAYTAGSPTITSVDVRTRRGTADATSSITLSTAQQSSTNLSFQPTGGPAVSAEPYKWFWIEVPEQDRVTLGTVRT